MTVHLDWYRDERKNWCVEILDDTLRFVLVMIESGHRSSVQSVTVIDVVREGFETTVSILVLVTDLGAEFDNPRQKERSDQNHEFEGYLLDHDIQHTLCAYGRPQSNGRLERIFQTYDKQR